MRSSRPTEPLRERDGNGDDHGFRAQAKQQPTRHHHRILIPRRAAVSTALEAR